MCFHVGGNREISVNEIAEFLGKRIANTLDAVGAAVVGYGVKINK